MNYAEAKKVADEIIAKIRPLCIRAEIAGSVRRQKQDMIKDIEIVAIPNPVHAYELHSVVNSHWGKPAMGAWPSLYTKIRTHVNIDFFWTDPVKWGLLFFIRTGPAEYGERMLRYWKQITNGGKSENCILHLADGTPVFTPEEEDVYRVLEKYSGKPCRWQPPEKRTAIK
jgi:DNA polymerase/3'-5' exonuclease PolX